MIKIYLCLLLLGLSLNVWSAGNGSVSGNAAVNEKKQIDQSARVELDKLNLITKDVPTIPFETAPLRTLFDSQATVKMKSTMMFPSAVLLWMFMGFLDKTAAEQGTNM